MRVCGMCLRFVCAYVLCVLCMLCVHMYGLFLCTGIYFSFSPSLCLLTVLEALTLDLIFPSVFLPLTLLLRCYFVLHFSLMCLSFLCSMTEREGRRTGKTEAEEGDKLHFPSPQPPPYTLVPRLTYKALPTSATRRTSATQSISTEEKHSLPCMSKVQVHWVGAAKAFKQAAVLQRTV